MMPHHRRPQRMSRTPFSNANNIHVHSMIPEDQKNMTSCNKFTHLTFDTLMPCWIFTNCASFARLLSCINNDCYTLLGNNYLFIVIIFSTVFVVNILFKILYGVGNKALYWIELNWIELKILTFPYNHYWIIAPSL